MRCQSWLAVVALAAPLAAQQPAKLDSMGHAMMGPGGPGMMPGMMTAGSMMREMGPAMTTMMLYTPQHLLGHRESLGLTADQVNRLTALRDGSKTTLEAAMTEAQAHMKELEETATAPKPDTAALKTHFQAAHNAAGKAHWTMLVSALQARAVLTDAQRAKIRTWADSMQAWTEQHRKMMNPSESH